jgi:hypothetical protein
MHQLLSHDTLISKHCANFLLPQVWMFGGAVLVSPKDGIWEPSHDLVAFRISRSGPTPGSNSSSSSSSSTTGTRAEVEAPVKHARVWPGSRSGHALVYLQPDLAKRFGCVKGALLMFGGSDIKALSINALTSPDTPTGSTNGSAGNATDADKGAEKGAAQGKTDSQLYGIVHNTTWDTQLWLYDVSAKKWSTLEATGTAPHLMYHGMTIAGSQVSSLSHGASRPVCPRRMLPVGCTEHALQCYSLQHGSTCCIRRCSLTHHIYGTC